MATLKPSSAPGLDGLPNDVVILAAPHLQGPLLEVFSAAIRLTHFPSAWKAAKISIIPKQNKTHYETPENFRLISVLPALGKVFEKIILGRLKWHANEGTWFNINQHGFIEGKSTETAAHALVDRIESGFQQKKYTACLFLDIKAAFDSAWHPAILRALIRRNCPSYLVKIIAAFLAERTGTLTLSEGLQPFRIVSGCPQGSALSAFLWLTLIEDVFHLNLSDGLFNLAYADDLVLTFTDADPEKAVSQVQEASDRISSWCDEVKLSLNASKSVLVVFDYHKRSSPISGQSFKVSINGIPIVSTDKTIYLGLHLDKKLRWDDHIDAKCQAASRAIFAARRCLALTWGLNRKRLATIYRAAIEPILLYCCSVWAAAAQRKKLKQKLRGTQRKMAQLITRTFRTSSTEALLVLSGLAPIDSRIQEITAIRALVFSNLPFCPSSKAVANRLLLKSPSVQGIERASPSHFQGPPAMVRRSGSSNQASPKNSNSSSISCGTRNSTHIHGRVSPQQQSSWLCCCCC